MLHRLPQPLLTALPIRPSLDFDRLAFRNVALIFQKNQGLLCLFDSRRQELGDFMKRLSLAAAAGCALFTVNAANAQPAVGQPVTPEASAPAPTALVIPAAAASNAVLPAGTVIRMRSLTELHSNTNKTGEQFDVEVAEDVMVNGVVVIPRGSIGRGEITRAKKKGMWGRSGRMETRLLSVRSNGMTIPITGSIAEKGDTGTAGVVASIAVLPIAGFFVTGTSAVLPVGTPYTGRTESDIPLVLPAAAAPQTVLAPATIQ